MFTWLRFSAFAMVVLGEGNRVSAADTASPYEAVVMAHRAERRQRLTKPDGWLSLVALHFLKTGENSVGAAAGNSIVLPKGPAHLGSLTLQPDGNVYISLNPAADARVDGREVLRARLEASEEHAPTGVTCETLSMFVIERGGRKALRVKDSESPRRKEFLGLNYFPIDPSWRIEAQWVEFEHPREVMIANVLGQESPAMIPGKAVFTREGHRFELLPLIEGVDEPLFFVISDATSGKETYPAARFVYSDPPRGGKLILDFNEAVNPPCAFTPFATCPLPPNENRMLIAVTAGEMKYAGSTE
ncbi:MAG: DUF1684 domain-containing protein [Opitutus sp.]